MRSPSSDTAPSGRGDLLVAPVVGDARPLPLAEARDPAVFGAKAVHLGEAVRSGLPVPAGFALPADLVAAVAAGDPRARQQLMAARATLGRDPVAVRSSAVGEDAAEASFAGQHATVLNAADVLAAVESVASSVQQASAAAYRSRLGQPSTGAVGIVLQRLVPACVAGVLFTCDPVTGVDELVIEASWALGEAVVSGLVTPDLYRLSADGVVRSVRPGRKDRAVVAGAAGGTRVVAVPPAEATRRALDDGQLAQLAALARRVRQIWPGHSDLEYAFSSLDGGLALLQRRPVTSGRAAAGRGT